MTQAGYSEAFVVAGEFNTSAPAPVNGQKIPLQVDSAGNLLVNVAVGGGGGGSNASVGLTGSNVPTSATFVGAQDIAGHLAGLLVDASGFLKVNVAAGGGSGGTSSTFGAAFPGTGTAAGASDGTNMQPLLVDASGFLKVNIAAGSSSGVQFADNAVSGATPTGTLAMGWDSANSKVRALKVDASQFLEVNVAAIGTVTVAGTVNIGTMPAVDVTDRSARLLGHVTVDNSSIAVTGAFFQSTQPVSIASGQAVSGSLVDITNEQFTDGTTTPPSKVVLIGGKTADVIPAYDALPLATGGGSVVVSGSVNIGTMPAVDVTDRSARLLGHVTVDNAVVPVDASPTSNVVDLLVQLLSEMRSVRTMFQISFSESGQARETDFEPYNFREGVQSSSFTAN